MTRLRQLLMLIAFMCLAGSVPALARGAGVTPKSVDVTIPAAGSTDVAKMVATTRLPPKSDFVFLADNTGSMGPFIHDVQANSQAIIDAIEASGATDAQYGVANYQDFQTGGPCPYGFQLNTNLTNATAAKSAINTWAAGDGCDIAEASFFGLHRVAVHDISWRPGSARFIIWFGDAPSHDPICSALPSYNDPHSPITQASVTADLLSQGIHVIAANIVDPPNSPGLDADPTPFSSGYDSTCGPPDGSPGQAASIAAATGGVELINPPGSSISATIIAALAALPPIPVTVTPTYTCEDSVTLTFAPPSQVVNSGDTANFTETIHAGTTAGTFHCTVDFLINGAPAGPDFEEAVTVHVTAGPPAHVTLTPPAATNVAGQPHCVVAHVTDAFGNPIEGATVNFAVSGANAAAGAGTTDAGGNAQFCYTGTHAGLDTITATVAGTLISATATKLYVAGTPASLVLSPKTAVNVVDAQHCVTATVRDAFGNPTPGVVVRFSVAGSVSTSGSATTNALGQATFCYTGPGLPGADVISAFADSNGNGTQDPGEPSDTATKLWVLPASTAGCKVTYGGTITAANGDPASFGGNAQVKGSPKGQEEYQDHGPATPVNVHSLTVDAVVCSADGTSASIFGTATIDGGGSFNYRIDLRDLGEPGSNDRYRIRLSNGYDSGDQQLNGGNVQIH
jgi:hypothetical protein